MAGLGLQSGVPTPAGDTVDRSAATVVGAYCDFVECAIHCILYERAVYPTAVFSRGRYLSHPCHIARHPLLVSYIGGVVSAVRSAALQASALRVVVVLFDSAHTHRQCLERFVFECRRARTVQAAAGVLDALQSELAQCISKLTQCNTLLAPLSPATRCSFTTLLYTQHTPQHDDSEASWQSIDLSVPPLSIRSPSTPLPLIVPLRSIRTALLDVEVYVEESADKNTGSGNTNSNE